MLDAGMDTQQALGEGLIRGGSELRGNTGRERSLKVGKLLRQDAKTEMKFPDSDKCCVEHMVRPTLRAFLSHHEIVGLQRWFRY